MSYKDKTAYELVYWVPHKSSDCEGPKKYLAYLAHFGLTPADLAGVVVDVGAGPRGGILQVCAPRKGIVIDPLLDTYEKNGLLCLPEGTQKVCSLAENISGISDVDYLFCTNALDHHPQPQTDTVEKALDAMLRTLKSPGGTFCLWVHLRKKAELDFGHDISIRLDTISHACKKYRVAISICETYKNDPVGGGKWTTLCLRGTI